MVGLNATGINFNLIKKQSADFAKVLRREENRVIEILLQYEPYNVAQYEVRQCIHTFENIDENQEYLKEKVGTISAFLPSNLPFYSVTIFGLVPGFMAENVYVHPTAALRQLGIVESVSKILMLEKYFPNVHISPERHDIFVEKYVKRSKVIIFTGRGTTRAKIEKEMLNDSILLFNGSGHNPFVVAENADVNKAVNDSVLVKFFNSGQDCAGPDTIFVHKKIAKEFTQKFKNETSKLIVDKFSNKNSYVGPIFQETELKRLEAIINDNKDHIIYGGKVDFATHIAHPTIAFSKITEKVNFKEIFGPIAFIAEYEDDEELKSYFQDKGGKYQYNKMYCSLYGNSEYIKSNSDLILLKDNGNTKNGVGIVLNNQTVLDIDEGTKAYGGYSKGASCVIYKNLNGEISKNALPILIPEVITELLVHKKSVNDLKVQNSSVQRSVLNLNGDFVLKIENEFVHQVNSIFGSNVEFAFIFGSIAKRTFKMGKSDINTFICLKEIKEIDIDSFSKWKDQFQRSLGLKSDSEHSSQIMTYNVLESAVENLEEVEISFPYSDKSSEIFWACILPSFHKKRAFVGGEVGGRKLSDLAKKCKLYPTKWAEELVRLFNENQEIPVSFQKFFRNLSKEEISQKLTKLFKDHEYGEILRLIKFNGTKSLNDKVSFKAIVENELYQENLKNIVANQNNCTEI